MTTKGSWNRIIGTYESPAKRRVRIAKWRDNYDAIFPDKLEILANGDWRFPNWDEGVYLNAPAPKGEALNAHIRERVVQRINERRRDREAHDTEV